MGVVRFLGFFFFFGVVLSKRITFTPDNVSNEYGEIVSLNGDLVFEDDEFYVLGDSSGIELILYSDKVDLEAPIKITTDGSTSSDHLTISNNNKVNIACQVSHCYISSINVDFVPYGSLHKPTGEYIRAYREAFESSVSSSRRLQDAGSDYPTTWSCPIPYTFDDNLEFNTDDIIEAMDYISKKTGWTFIERTIEDDDYITFFNDSGCSSPVGRQTNQQLIKLSPNCGFGAIVHEIGHSIGLAHEHVREDRNNFVDIIESNIPSGSTFDNNFPISPLINFGDYDYGSIMHYSQYAFAIDNSIRTVIPINDLGDTCLVGQSFELSDEDVLHYNNLIEGDSCSTLAPDPCDITDIVVCGASSIINGFRLPFQEYALIDEFNGRPRYRSKRSHRDNFFWIYWASFDAWIIEWDLNLRDYAFTYENDLFDANGNWEHYSLATGEHEEDPALIVSPLDCSPCDQLIKCEDEPCDIVEGNINCKIYNFPAGCNQCNTDYFKKNHNYQCQQCQDVFGDACLFCQDYNGCGQCDDDYQRVFDSDCDMWECVADGSITSECNEDVIIAIDDSGSINDAELEIIKDASKELISVFDSSSIFGVLTFNSAITLYALLGFSQQGAINAVNNIININGETNFIPAIEEAIDQFETRGRALRPDILIFITDGDATDNPCSFKDDLDDANIKVIIIGIGANFLNPLNPRMECLVNDISSQIYHVDDIDTEQFGDVINIISNDLCGCPNGADDSSLDIDSNGCPIACDSQPCSCNELCFCDICHVNGCEQCLTGYFKKHYDYPCIQCQEMFGNECLFCQDFNGCGQCRTGCNRVYNSQCGLWECDC